MQKYTRAPTWKVIERIVSLLEKTLSPLAKVEHNVLLPVLGSESGRKRQCDIVITYGKEPRQTIAIVEVQKRKSKPEINTFHGWLEKMKEVGAQQLICVSALGYPKSIIEYVANRTGPTVTLMTLDEIEETSPCPIFMLPHLINTTPKFHIEEVGIIKLGVNKEDEISFDNEFKTEINTDAKFISIGEEDIFFSINDLVCNLFNQNLPQYFKAHSMAEPEVYTVEILLTESDNKSIELTKCERDCLHVMIVLDLKSKPMWLNWHHGKFKILNWTIKVKIEKENQILNIPMAQFAYRQETIDGALVWIASTEIQLQGKCEEIQLIFKADKDGFLQVQLTNIPLSKY